MHVDVLGLGKVCQLHLSRITQSYLFPGLLQPKSMRPVMLNAKASIRSLRQFSSRQLTSTWTSAGKPASNKHFCWSVVTLEHTHTPKSKLSGSVPNTKKKQCFLMNTMLEVTHRCQIPSEHVMQGQAAENACPAFPRQCGCRPWRFGRWLANLELPNVSEIQQQELT